MTVAARSQEELQALGPGHYVGIGYPSTRFWVTADDPIVAVQRRVNAHKLDPDHVPLRPADLGKLAAWLSEAAP